MEEASDPIDSLVSQLGRFHIGTSWRVVPAVQIEGLTETVNREADITEGQEQDASKDEVSERPDHTMFSEVVAGRMSISGAVSISSSIEADNTFLAEEEERSPTIYRPVRMVLPSPKPGDRPCWEPPILDYSLYDDFINAHNALITREGRGNIRWRTHFLDVGLEDDCLEDYLDWVQAMLDDDIPWDVWQFYSGLQENLKEDKRDVAREWHEVRYENGRKQAQDYSRRLTEEFNAARRRRGVPAIEVEDPWDSSTVSVFSSVSGSEVSISDNVRSQSPLRGYLSEGYSSSSGHSNELGTLST